MMKLKVDSNALGKNGSSVFCVSNFNEHHIFSQDNKTNDNTDKNGTKIHIL